MSNIADGTDSIKIQIARDWLDRGRKAELDPFARFLFYFTGLNALYVLWDCSSVSESIKIKRLIGRLSEKECESVLNATAKEVSYFYNRESIRRMRYCDDQTRSRLCTRPLREGQSSAKERVKLLGEIVYCIRCNLIHGDKRDRGDDHSVVANAINLVERLLAAALQYSEANIDEKRLI